jgi:hypothetical protein
MTAVKATLTVILKANDVVVAEVQDPALWQRVLTAMLNDLSGDPSSLAKARGETGRKTA